MAHGMETRFIDNSFPASRVTEKRNDDTYISRERIVSDDTEYKGSDPEKTSFKKAFEIATKGNEDEQNVLERKSESGNSQKTAAGHQTETEPVKQDVKKTDTETKCENLVASESAESKITQQGIGSSTQAMKLIKEALTTLSEKLHLNISIRGLEELDLEVLSDAVLEQFSEIIFALQSIAQVLEQAADQGVALEIKGAIFEPAQAKALTQLLRSEIFKLQLGIEMLGVAGEVNRSVADKANIPVKDGGIPQAVNPVNLSMSDNQLRQVFGELVVSKEKAIADVVGRIAAIAQKAVTETIKYQVAGETVNRKQDGVVVNNLPASVEIVKNGKMSEAGVLDFSQLDSKVMRKLLKIDTVAQSPVSEAKETKPMILSGLQPSAINKSVQQLFVLQTDANEQALAADNVIRGSSIGQQTDAVVMKTGTIPFKVVEESVIMQMAHRFISAVRHGMHEVKLTLKPASLGDVRMTIQMDGDVIMARISVESMQVKQIIEANLQTLKNALEEQNINTGAFDVNVNHGSERDGQETSHDINSVKKDGNDEEQVAELSKTDAIHEGVETGRRYGSNSIEYFA